MNTLPPNAPAWTDLVLLAMGIALLVGFGVGLLLPVPMRVAGSAGSLLAAAVFLGGIARNPTPL